MLSLPNSGVGSYVGSQNEVLSSETGLLVRGLTCAVLFFACSCVRTICLIGSEVMCES